MLDRPPRQPDEDPAVAPVEATLDTMATHQDLTASPSEALRPATHAVRICACVSLDDAPVWLIYGDDDGRVMWCRIPDGDEAADVVAAERTAGGHTDPGSVLAWLRREAPGPWAGGEGCGDADVVPELDRRMHCGSHSP